MLECDTKIITSRLTKGFIWLVHLYFPFPAYIHIVQNLKGRPVSDQAEQAWDLMSDNYEARFGSYRDEVPFFIPFYKIFARIVLQAWEAREATFKQSGQSLLTPRIVLSVRQKVALIAQNSQNSDGAPPTDATGMGISDSAMSMPMTFDCQSIISYNMGGPDDYAGTHQRVYPTMRGLAPLDFDINQIDWSAMDWNLMNAPTEETGESTDLSLPHCYRIGKFWLDPVAMWT